MKKNNEENLNENKKKINTKLNTIIILGIIIAVAVVGFIGYTIYKNNQCTENSNTSSPWAFPRPGVYKPVIYLYPEKTIEISVTLCKPENITCSYPDYKSGWNVIANPDGSLIDKNTGRQLYSLYWEGIQSEPVNLEEGFVVEGKDTIQFLEEKLEILGLTETEAEEFIIYWLPKLQNNKYNYIRFATMDEIDKNMPLEFSIEPDTTIRVLMQYKALDNYIEVNEQKLETPERTGFVAVEWGGTEIK